MLLGVTKGRGFAGVVRRHGFTGGVASHGSTLGKSPGSIELYEITRYVLLRVKRLPGHMGAETAWLKNLEVVKIDPEENLVLVKGSVPGKSGSLVFMRRA